MESIQDSLHIMFKVARSLGQLKLLSIAIARRGHCSAETNRGESQVTNKPQRKVKVGVVGCGVVATAYYLPCLMRMDTVDLVAVCDRFPTRTQASARLFGAREQYQ